MSEPCLIFDVGSYAARYGDSKRSRPESVVSNSVGVDSEGRYQFDLESFDETVKMQKYSARDDRDALESLLASLVATRGRDVMWVDDFVRSKSRDQIVEILMETHGCSSLSFLNSAVATCFSVARTSGFVVEAGCSSTRACVVNDAFVVPDSREAVESLGSNAIDRALYAEFYATDDADEPVPIDTASGRVRLRDVSRMRESIGDVQYVMDPEVEIYHLPDGTKLSSTEVSSVVENSFFPEKHDAANLTWACMRSLERAFKSADERRKQFANTILVGGLSSTPSLDVRLRYELDLKVPKSAPSRPWVFRPDATHRSVAPWLGGAVAGSLSLVRQENFVSAALYGEKGDAAFKERCQYFDA